VNESGQVIGMITAAERAGFDRRVSDVGYAIPLSNALDVVETIRSGGSDPRIVLGQPGFLGVQVETLDAARATNLGLNVDAGALVVGVVPGTPAADVGIPAPSVITGVDGASISSADELGPAIYRHKPGERIEVTWVDRAGTHTEAVRLVAGPAV
jgi:S1-C subfamily serine protease